MSLAVYVSETEKFDQKLIKDFLTSCEHISNVRENPREGIIYDADFMFLDYELYFCVFSNLIAVSMDNRDDVAVHLCYLLQAFYPKPLHVMDENLEIDFIIADYDSPESLYEAMLQVWNQGKR